MKLGWLPVVGLAGLAACAELFGPRVRTVGLTIIPVFDVADPYAVAAATADSLRIRVVAKDGTGAFADTVARVTVGIDPDSGTATATITVVLLESPQSFLVVIAAVRSSDGAVLFSGLDTVQVSGTAPGAADSIPVRYVGPRAARIVLAPQDTALANGASFTYRVTAYDSTNAVVNVPVGYSLLNPGDSTLLTVNRLTGAASASASGSGLVRVLGMTPDSLARDTGHVYVGAVAVAVRITPGSDNVGVDGTLQLTGHIVDPLGNPISTSVSWTSRNPDTATVSSAGLVQGIVAGTAVIVATGSNFSDSALMTVVTPTHAVMATSSVYQSSPRGFRTARVGDTVVVDVTADMRFTPDEKLGSYNATLTWSSGVLQYIDVQAGAFAAPVVNADNASGGTLRFSAADPNGAAGQLVVARVRFRAAAQGATAAALTVSEMSAAVTFTNLSAENRVTVTSGHVTVRP
ncbi:MAG: Ig-like domain-containing protein [Gemmatimonadetes bacterium]|nr:Ig-like domain-containing protein [Gemmatimonadota bacterium]MBI3082562.1 Ig-like domain-containing protein [Gemmatimonadota bacterium]